MIGSAGARLPRTLSGSTGFSAAGRNAKVRQERNTNFKVVIRVRPPLPRELSGEVPFRNVVAIDDREQCITVSENLAAVLDSDGQVVANPGPYTTYSFMFDYVYDQYSNQAKVYETTASTVVDSALQGYNATVFAYGQTGAGKTYTMEGFNREGNIEERGIIPRAIEQIFNHIQQYASPRMRFLVRASYLQIYNEQVSDLLKPERNNLSIREDKKRGVYVDGLSEWVVRSPAEIYGLMERGASVRATGETKMNEMSSRSHAVFIVIAEQSETVYVDDHGQEMSPEDFQRFMHTRGIRQQRNNEQDNRMEDHVRQTFKVGKLNLVDLAGSERVNLSGATGMRLEESKQINKSLSMLGSVIKALTEAKENSHIPYRNSKLTRMLEDSLGGNCKTTMMAMISPAFEAMMETISTLKFANRAKNIRNEARVNEDLDQKSLLRKYERELKKLRAELEERSKNVVDKRRLLELDEQRRRAEADKMAAIKALEARSLEFMKEKEEKKKLEQRIAMLTSQMLRGERSNGGGNNSANPGQDANGNESEVRQQYEAKLAEMEREREGIEAEKAQVDRYKQLLLKQRDIMIALTQRLVERDEQIVNLQDELDSYDQRARELEEKLDEKTALLIKFQRISMEVNAKSPMKNEELNEALLSSWDVNDDSRLPPSRRQQQQSQQQPSSGPMEVMRSIDMEHQVKLQNTVNQQAEQISQLEGRLAETMLTSSRVERALASEVDQYLRSLPSESARSTLREPFKAIMAQALQRLKDGAFANDSAASTAPVSSVNGAELTALQEENDRLKMMVAQQMQQLQQQQRKTDNSSNNEEVALLQTRCDTLVKEREAVQTIMEHKIKVLVQSVAQSANTVLGSLPPDAAGSLPASQALAKDMTALSKLVNASIAALRNAANASTNNQSNGSNTGANSNGGAAPTPPTFQQQGSFSRSSSARAPGPPRVPVAQFDGAAQQPLISQWDER